MVEVEAKPIFADESLLTLQFSSIFSKSVLLGSGELEACWDGGCRCMSGWGVEAATGAGAFQVLDVNVGFNFLSRTS